MVVDLFHFQTGPYDIFLRIRPSRIGMNEEIFHHLLSFRVDLVFALNESIPSLQVRRAVLTTTLLISSSACIPTTQRRLPTPSLAASHRPLGVRSLRSHGRRSHQPPRPPYLFVAPLRSFRKRVRNASELAAEQTFSGRAGSPVVHATLLQDAGGVERWEESGRNAA